MARKPVPAETQVQVLVKSGRRCALCFGLGGKLDEVPGQIAHVNRDPENFALENLAFLCMPHHDAYDSKTSQSKGHVPGELIHYRDRLYAAVEKLEHLRNDRIATGAVTIEPSVLEHDRLPDVNYKLPLAAVTLPHRPRWQTAFPLSSSSR